MGLRSNYFERQIDLQVNKRAKPKQKLVRLYDQSRIFNELFEIKRARKAADKKYKGLFFNIGLFSSLALVTFLINWKTYSTSSLVELSSNRIYEDELIEIPPTKQLPPPPIKVLQQPNIIEVQNEELIKEEIKIDLDININEDTYFETPEVIAVDAPVEEVAEEVFTIVENKPEPKNGLTAFYKYINDNIKYPPTAIRQGIEGRVFVQFIINKDGHLSELKVVKGIGAGCDEEAVRVLQNAEPWNPGKQRGQPVRVRMIIPISFVLSKN